MTFVPTTNDITHQDKQPISPFNLLYIVKELEWLIRWLYSASRRASVEGFVSLESGKWSAGLLLDKEITLISYSLTMAYIIYNSS